MRSVLPSIVALFAMSGCTTLPADQGSMNNPGAEYTRAADPSPPAIDMTPSPSIGPRLIVPATGGPPVLGIPVGGDLFVPVTGGAPVVGFPVSP